MRRTAKSHDTYDPLDVGLWDFYVFTRTEVDGIKYKSIGLTTLVAPAGPATSFDDLRERIREAFERQRSDVS
jgi:hypothetical protein